MLKTIAHDTVNDVVIIQTNQGYFVRYGSESRKCRDIYDAISQFQHSVAHALECEGHMVD